MIIDIGKYYIYRHIRIDTNEVFYIGLGTKYKANTKRTQYYRAYSKDYRNKYWNNITKKTNYSIEIILESDDYDFIQKKEIEFIKLYGRKNLKKGTLCNLNDGGNSNNNMIVSEETKYKQSIARKGIFKMSEEHKAKLSKLYKGVRPCELAIKNLIKANLRPISQYTKEGIWIKDFSSLKEAVKFLNLKSHSSISSNLNNRYKSAHGYIWKYKKK